MPRHMPCYGFCDTPREIKDGLPAMGKTYAMSTSTMAPNRPHSGPGTPPRDGVMRTRTTVRLFPDEEQFFRDRGKELGLTLSDTLAYYLALASDRDVQPAIRRQLAEHNATNNEALQDPLVA